MRLCIVYFVISSALASIAPVRAATPDDASALALLGQIGGSDPATRNAAMAKLDKVAPTAIDDIASFLARKRETAIEQRRQVLAMIGAEVPDSKGRFPAPPRRSAKDQELADNLDWLAALTALPSSTDPLVGLSEVIADDAAIRALARTNDMRAASILFSLAFGEETIIYRDEIGRYLRTMEPYSVPALVLESQSRNYDRRRYATYQLERIDRQEPGKALRAAAGDESLAIALLEGFAATRHREAVHAVWTKVNADSPRIRSAARTAWMAYITGPPPPPAPKKRLQLPGGKLTKKEKPLWLTYRELADNELRKAANELLHENLPLEDPRLDDNDDDRPVSTVKVDLTDLTQRVWAHYDGERAAQQRIHWSAANALAQAGDLNGATTQIDRMLAQDPEHDRKVQMAAIYFRHAKELERQQKWVEAEAAYSKAFGLDPEGSRATEALAGHHFSLGKSLEAKGKNGAPDFRRAVALRPDYGQAKAAAKIANHLARPTWPLWGAGAAFAAALGLLAAGMIRRRT
jgi:tetratricopeptide (TPR) repeat protein